jgi:hypothetical protein
VKGKREKRKGDEKAPKTFIISPLFFLFRAAAARGWFWRRGPLPARALLLLLSALSNRRQVRVLLLLLACFGCENVTGDLHSLYYNPDVGIGERTKRRNMSFEKKNRTFHLAG